MPKEDTQFKSGKDWTGNANGRPKGKTIKDLVREYLEEHPNDMKAFVDHFVKKNRELAWQMLEGKPHQAGDITSGGKPIPILNVQRDDSDKEDSEAEEKD